MISSAVIVLGFAGVVPELFKTHKIYPSTTIESPILVQNLKQRKGLDFAKVLTFPGKGVF